MTADELTETLAAAELRLVLTAHPTEARRRTTIEKLARIFGTLRELDDGATPERTAFERLAEIAQELWGSDDVRTVALDVADEVQGGLDYLSTTLARTAPAVYREIEAAIAEVYPGEEVRIPPLLTFGSWMGGDRDGNPNVTPEVTVQTLAAMRTACLPFLEARLGEIGGRLSMSSRVTGISSELEAMAEAAAEDFPELWAELVRRHPEEPYRRAFSIMRARTRAARKGLAGGYAGAARAARRPARGRARAAVAAGALRRRRRAARPDPPGRGVRLPLRAARHPRAREDPPPRDRRRSSPRCGCTSPTTRSATTSARRCWRARSPTGAR